LFTDPPFLLVSPSLFQVAAELWMSMAVQLLVVGLCKGELVDGDEGDGSVVCCCRPLLGSSVGGGCEGDSCWEGKDGVSQAGGGGIGCCCMAWWRPALMETEGEEDAVEGKASVKGSCNWGDGDESVRLLWFWWGRLLKKRR